MDFGRSVDVNLVLSSGRHYSGRSVDVNFEGNLGSCHNCDVIISFDLEYFLYLHVPPMFVYLATRRRPIFTFIVVQSAIKLPFLRRGAIFSVCHPNVISVLYLIEVLS